CSSRPTRWASRARWPTRWSSCTPGGCTSAARLSRCSATRSRSARASSCAACADLVTLSSACPPPVTWGRRRRRRRRRTGVDGEVDARMHGTSIGFVGTGPMGAPMARNLLAAGYDVALWNRTAAKAQAVAGNEPRATVASTPAQVARPVVVVMLPDLPQVRDVVDRPDGLRAGWRAAGTTDPVLVVMSTVSAVDVRAWATELAAEGVRLVDAPVSGGVEGAEAGRLSIMAGGA